MLDVQSILGTDQRVPAKCTDCNRSCHWSRSSEPKGNLPTDSKRWMVQPVARRQTNKQTMGEYVMMTATLEAVDTKIELVPSIECEQLRVSAVGVEGKVDTESKTIFGFVVAQLGPFRTAGRGEFDDRSLRQLVRLMKLDPDGLPCYYKHASPVEPDRLGWFLGRAKNPRIETIGVLRNGEKLKLSAVLADLHLDDSAFEGNPNGDIGGYVLKLAKSDPRSFSSSLTLHAAKEHRLLRGRPVLDEQTGQPLPPIFRPLELASIDIVQSGEAVDSFLPSKLSANQDFFSVLDSVFSGSERLSVEAAIDAMMDRYLAYRFDEPNEQETTTPVPESPPTPIVSDDALRLDLYLVEQE